MKDETSQPIEPSGGGQLEARIVAWVMGEASAFEAAELERLCAERAELEAFRKEMLAVHRMLAEDGKEAEKWRLPGEKRRVVEALFGDEEEKIARRNGWRVLWAVAACVVVTAGVVWFGGMRSGEMEVLAVNAVQEKSVDYMPAGARTPSRNLEVRRKEIRELEDRVEEKRKVVASIIRTKGIVDTGGAGVFRQDGIDENQGPRSAVESYNALARQKIELESQVQNLLKYDDDQLIRYAAGLDLQDNAIRTLYPQYLEQQRELSAMKSEGYGDEHPEVAARKGTLENTKRQIEKGVADLKETLQVQLELSEARLAQVGNMRDGRKEEAITRSLDVQDYIDAKADFERELSLLQQMRRDLMEDLGSELSAEVEYINEYTYRGASLAPEQQEEVDPVRRGLYLGAGSFNLGKYDEAKEAYEKVLRADPYNSAARHGLERVAAAKQEYYQAAYDQTRAELLMRVDRLSELSVPVDSFVPGQPSEPWARALPASPMVSAGEEPVSTFSLNVSDVSFQLAKAALEKGRVPDPAGVKVEQFYNAVDYGDLAASAGEKVAGTIEQARDPLLPGTNLVRIGLRTAAAGRMASRPLRLTLLVDQSGSMTREDRREALEHAVKGVGELLKPEDRVTVVGFSRTARLVAEGLSGEDAAKLAQAVAAPGGGEGTNLEEALRLGGELALRQRVEGAQNRVVLMTDGAANLGDAEPGRLAERVKEMRAKGIALDVAGVGVEGLNDRLLGELARTGDGRYLVVDGDFAERLAGAFRPAAEDVKVQVRFNPERVARYRLVGFERERLAEEDFRDDSVDAGELAAEESGVALYQVELLPEGKGGIGDVAVRFRDAGNGEAVERSWTIGYDPSVPAFDRARPSMQLAGLAMMAGEKLRRGPLAEAVDFRNFTEAAANVRNYYAGSKRAADLLRMIELLSK